jgi:hypothetical protein
LFFFSPVLFSFLSILSLSALFSVFFVCFQIFLGRKSHRYGGEVSISTGFLHPGIPVTRITAMTAIKTRPKTLRLHHHKLPPVTVCC